MKNRNNYNEAISVNDFQTIMSWLEDVITVKKSHIAIVDNKYRITYCELGEKIEKYAGVFTKLGIKKGHNVILHIPNKKEYIYAFFGLIKIGATPVVINPSLGAYEIDGIIKQTKAIAYLYCQSYTAYCSNILKRIKENHRDIIVLSDEDMNNLCCENNYIDVFHEENIEDIAFLMMSGGTTGTPKIVPITHRMIFWHIFCYCKKFGLTSDDSYLAILPLSHKIGLYSPGFLNFLFVGGKTVLCQSGSCDEWFSLIEREKLTSTSIVPTLSRIWLDFLKYDNSYDLSSIRTISIGGAMVNPRVISELIYILHCDIRIVYGTTEGLSIYGVYNMESKVITNSYKYLLSGHEDIKIINEKGQILKENQAGELIIKGPYTINNYFNINNNIVDKFTEDGYFKTGDIAIWTKENGYKILGRVVDQINRAGEKIDPGEIEYLISTYPEINEAVSVGVENEFFGEKHCLFIKSNNANIKIREVRKFLKLKGIASYKLPDELIILNNWPLTPVNKIDRKKLKEMATFKNKEGVI